MPVKTLDPKGEWIWRGSHIDWRKEKVLVRTLGPEGGRHQEMCQGDYSLKGVNTRWCASKDTGPKRGWIWQGSHIDWRKEKVLARTLGPEGGRHREMCQGDYSLKGVDTRRCASKDAGPKRGWIWQGSHIDWRKERVPARTLDPKGGRLWYPIVTSASEDARLSRE